MIDDAEQRIADRRRAGRRTGHRPGRRNRAPACLQRRIDRAEDQRAGLAGRGPARVARQRHCRDLRRGRRTYRQEHQRGGQDDRRQHARAERHARRRARPRSPRSSTRPRGRWSTASPTAAASCRRAWRRRRSRRPSGCARENAALVNALANRTAETLAAVDGARSLAFGERQRPDRPAFRIELAAQRADRSGQARTCSASTRSCRARPTSSPRPPRRPRRPSPRSARLIDANTNRLTELSQAALREVAAIASRFDEHGRLLANASNLIAAAQSNFEHTLERQSSLEDLAVGLVEQVRGSRAGHEIVREPGRHRAGKGRGPHAGIDRQDPQLRSTRSSNSATQALLRRDRGHAPDGGDRSAANWKRRAPS